MKKKAKEVQVGDKLSIGGETLTVVSTESSDIGKQGTQKCRIVSKKANGEQVVLIRPADYPLDVI